MDFQKDKHFIYALRDVPITAEAYYWTEKIRQYIEQDEMHKRKVDSMPISHDQYEMLEYKVSNIKLEHQTEEDIKALIDLALSQKDYDWVKKLKYQLDLIKESKNG